MEKPDITPDMIRAYDEFTHKHLDRRAFMARLTALTGSAAAAAVIAPLLAANPASAAIIAEDDARLETGMVSYGDMKGYLAKPKGATKPLGAVIVIHENRGLNPHTQDVARRMALEGFLTLAPDFLSPKGGTPTDEDAARKLIGELDGEQTLTNSAESLNFLKTHAASNGKVGAVGFCWGGGLVNRFATRSTDLKAGVAYYGAQAPLDGVPAITAPLLLHYAGIDDRINAGIEAYKAALTENKKTFEIHMYDGVNHAFNNDTSEARYNKAAADLAWGRTVAFFNKNLA